ncbi:MAG: hypothetical protein V4536_08575 [Pseudomonadota bacterium]
MINRERLKLCNSVANYEQELAKKRKKRLAEIEGQRIESALNVLSLVINLDKALRPKKKWYQF